MRRKDRLGEEKTNSGAGGLALLLATVGIAGVISHAVSLRTRAIGVRMALGARPADVLRLILTGGLELVLVGVAPGIAAATALTRFLAACCTA